MAKGGSFERLIATKLSLWWTEGKHDDTIWRSAMSGGRATVRGRKGKRTAGHSGDLCSTTAESADLFRAFAFELKCGYQHVTINDLIDRPKSAAFQKDGWDGWIDQATTAATMSESFAWMIIHQRSRGQKQAMVYIGEYAALKADAPYLYDFLAALPRKVIVAGTVRKPGSRLRSKVNLVGVPLDVILSPAVHSVHRVTFLDAVRLSVKPKRK